MIRSTNKRGEQLATPPDPASIDSGDELDGDEPHYRRRRFTRRLIWNCVVLAGFLLAILAGALSLGR